MARWGRPGLTELQKTDLWRRWRSGEGDSEMGRALDKFPASVFGILRLHGGYTPARRVRAAVQLTLAEREEISRGLSAGWSLRSIARELSRAPSTISREVDRNGGGGRRYRANRAESKAWERAPRPQCCRLAQHGALCDRVGAKLAQDGSPEQMAGGLKRTHPDDESWQVSHETIDKTLFVQSRGTLNKERRKPLRTQRPFRQSRQHHHRGSARGQIMEGVSIHERPPEVEDRAVPGHWEGDWVAGWANTYIATLVERQSRFTLLVRVEGKTTRRVVTALIRQMKHCQRRYVGH